MAAHWPAPAGLHATSARLPVEGRLPSFEGATGWLNSPPLTAAGRQGKIVLVNFWTYTCVNWLRQLPYLRAWAGKYADHGLAVIGVHTPEFPFEHDLDNVRRAVRDLRVDYPVAIDNDYGVWSAFANHYWPALYFADAQGRLRHHHFGEGEYQQSEMVIQQLLAEAGTADQDHELVSVDARGVEAPADWAHLRPTRATSVPRTSRLPAALCPASLACTPPQRSCDSITGPCPGTGPWRSRLSRSTRPPVRSPAGSTPATSTSSWAPPHRAPPRRSTCVSTDSHPVRRTGRTSMTKATGRWPSRDCTS
jgi:thiol-disulfide isomerase/thioredoxin